MFDRFRFGAKREPAASPEASRPKRARRQGEAAEGGEAEAEAEEAEEAEGGRAGDEGGEEQGGGEEGEDEDEGGEAPPPSEAADRAAARQVTPAVKWRERWRAVCAECFEGRRPCAHFPERRLRLLIVGHNPSDHAWTSGYSYSNPSNRMWGLLSGSLPPLTWAGVVPADATIAAQNQLPDWIGLGFTSIGLEAGNDAAKYGKATMSRWRDDFFRRLRLHAKQVCEAQHSGMKNDTSDGRCDQPHAPMIIAFSGKRQFTWLFTPPLKKLDSFGKQDVLPSLWPHELVVDSEVWVLPSSSGRAAMTTEQRVRPYQQLAERFHQIPWGESEAISSVVVVKDEVPSR